MSFNSELVLESKYGEARENNQLAKKNGDDLADLGRCRSASDGIHDYVTYSE